MNSVECYNLTPESVLPVLVFFTVSLVDLDGSLGDTSVLLEMKSAAILSGGRRIVISVRLFDLCVLNQNLLCDQRTRRSCPYLLHDVFGHGLEFEIFWIIGVWQMR